MNTYVFRCAVVVCGLSATIVSAQELACNCPSDPCCPRQSFDGWYVGGNVGVLSHLANRNDADGFLTDNSGWSTLDTNVAGGVQLGYDWQCGNRVFGVVADWNASNVQGFLQEEPNDPGDDNLIQSDLEWFTTIRVRAGLAIHDNLVYISAGPAVAGFDTIWQDDPNTFRDSDTRWGWAGTVGTEFKWTRNLSLGAELMYLNCADDTVTFSDGSTDYTFQHNDSAWSGRILMNYRFGR